MDTEPTISLLAQVQLGVEALVLARGTLEAVEALIDETPGLSKDERAALWLYGWSLLPPHLQRSEALAHLELVAEIRG